MAQLSLFSHHRRSRQVRRGAIAVLGAVLVIAILGMMAFAIDLGVLLVTRTELQRTADASALAAAAEFVEQGSSDDIESRVRETAQDFAARNAVLQSAPDVDANEENAVNGDIVVGALDGFDSLSVTLDRDDPETFNAVQVRVRRTAEMNGVVPFVFASVLGISGGRAEATAVAAVIKRIAGFRNPGSGDNLPILPITIHEDAWNQLAEDDGLSDEWAYDLDEKNVDEGSDGIPEVLLYPEDQGSPGNFGTVDIGPASNSTSHLSNQILNGISAEDLNYHGGELKLDESGSLTLNGETGISTGIKDELISITGQTRIIPVYREVSGNGNTASYTIVRFVGVRIMHVDLTGGDKRVYVQPAKVITRGVIPGTESDTSAYIYSPVVLVR